MHLEAMRLFAFFESLSVFLLKAISQSLPLFIVAGAPDRTKTIEFQVEHVTY